PDLPSHESPPDLLNRCVEMALSGAKGEQAVAGKEAVDSKIRQLSDIAPVAVHPAAFGINDSQHAAVKNHVPRKQPTTTVDLSEVAMCIRAVPAHMDCCELQARDAELLAIEQRAVHGTGLQAEIRRI